MILLAIIPLTAITCYGVYHRSIGILIFLFTIAVGLKLCGY